MVLSVHNRRLTLAAVSKTEAVRAAFDRGEKSGKLRRFDAVAFKNA
jgi:hypothetical protein